MTDKERAEMQAEIDRLRAANIAYSGKVANLIGRAGNAEDAQTAALNLIADIRAAAGDKEGKLMQSELVARIAGLRVDAERYRWLREQHWNTGPLGVVVKPKDSVKLGHVCPSLDRLDAAIDAGRSEKPPA